MENGEIQSDTLGLRKRQLIAKLLVVILLISSAYVSSTLLSTYLCAVFGYLVGAGAAQWQFSFILAPVPAVLGVLALAIAYWSRPRLSGAYVVVSSLAVAVPVALFVLVLLHLY